MYNTNNFPVHPFSWPQEPQKVYTAIKNRQSPKAELSNSKATHQAGQPPPKDSIPSFVWDRLAQTHQNQQVCRELANPAARKEKPSMPINKSMGWFTHLSFGHAASLGRVIAALLERDEPARRTDASFPCSHSAGNPLAKAEINHGELAVISPPSRTLSTAAAWLAGAGRVFKWNLWDWHQQPLLIFS